MYRFYVKKEYSKVHECFEMLFFTKKNIFFANELFGVAVNH